MTVGFVDLDLLHRQAESRPLDLDALPWAQGVQQGAWFAPEAMSHLFHCPSYAGFSDDERRALARITALTKAESFVYFEEFLLIPIVQQILRAPERYGVSPGLVTCLEDFVHEERQHTEMFWRLLEAAAPAHYPTRQLRYFGPTSGGAVLGKLLARRPDFFILWVWLALIIEERTVDLYRQYRSDPRVDPLFAAVYHAHMVDETRHVSIDHHLLATFWDPAPLWLRKLNVALLDHCLGKLTTPRVVARVSLAEVIDQSPTLRPQRATIAQELASLGKNASYQAAHFSRDCLPRSFALMDRYPEFATLRAGLPAYQPRTA
ncbi:MAG: diiron oxygenase [Candidatus Sericytochromatia bacterium]|nr:diiron oxygenase [Candidatus Sericytochromatia bacterium]